MEPLRARGVGINPVSTGFRDQPFPDRCMSAMTV